MWNLLKQLFGSSDKPVTLFERPRSRLDSLPDDFSWMHPPPTMSDSAPWDQFWYDQLRYGVAGLVHMFCDDGELVDVMRANGLKTVLCMGSGISFEPHALARVGFDVTALDLSPYAIETARRATPPEELLASLVGNRSAQDGGRVQLVTGDLRDATCCPGPYDVIIERKTLQLFPDADRPEAMHAAVQRLASPGIFVTHAHDGGWRPPEPRKHRPAEWFAAEGWPQWRQGDTAITQRIAWVLTTTG